MDWEKIESMYKLVRDGLYKKIEDTGVIVYRAGSIISIHIKIEPEKDTSK